MSISALKIIVAAGLCASRSPIAKDGGERLLMSTHLKDISGNVSRYLLENRRWIPLVNNMCDKFGIDYPSVLTEVAHWLGCITRIRQAEYQQILADLTQAKLPLVQFKGMDMLRFCDHPELRFMADLDLLCESDKLWEADRVLAANGFTQGYVDFSRENAEQTGFSIDPLHSPSDQWIRENGHELHPHFKYLRRDEMEGMEDSFVRANIKNNLVQRVNGRCYVKVAIDLHFNIASGFDFIDIDFEEKNGIKRVSLHIYLLFYAGRAYYETIIVNSPDIKSFVEFLTILSCSSMESIDWDRLRWISSKYRAYAPLLYCLKHAQEILLIDLSNEIQWYEERLLDDRSLDLGDMVPRMAECLSIMRLA